MFRTAHRSCCRLHVRGGHVPQHAGRERPGLSAVSRRHLLARRRRPLRRVDHAARRLRPPHQHLLDAPQQLRLPRTPQEDQLRQVKSTATATTHPTRRPAATGTEHSYGYHAPHKKTSCDRYGAQLRLPRTPQEDQLRQVRSTATATTHPTRRPAATATEHSYGYHAPHKKTSCDRYGAQLRLPRTPQEDQLRQVRSTATATTHPTGRPAATGTEHSYGYHTPHKKTSCDRYVAQLRLPRTPQEDQLRQVRSTATATTHPTGRPAATSTEHSYGYHAPHRKTSCDRYGAQLRLPHTPQEDQLRQVRSTATATTHPTRRPAATGTEHSYGYHAPHRKTSCDRYGGAQLWLPRTPQEDQLRQVRSTATSTTHPTGRPAATGTEHSYLYHAPHRKTSCDRYGAQLRLPRTPQEDQLRQVRSTATATTHPTRRPAATGTEHSYGYHAPHRKTSCDRYGAQLRLPRTPQEDQLRQVRKGSYGYHAPHRKTSCDRYGAQLRLPRTPQEDQLRQVRKGSYGYRAPHRKTSCDRYVRAAMATTHPTGRPAATGTKHSYGYHAPHRKTSCDRYGAQLRLPRTPQEDQLRQVRSTATATTHPTRRPAATGTEHSYGYHAPHKKTSCDRYGAQLRLPRTPQEDQPRQVRSTATATTHPTRRPAATGTEHSYGYHAPHKKTSCDRYGAQLRLPRTPQEDQLRQLRSTATATTHPTRRPAATGTEHSYGYHAPHKKTSCDRYGAQLRLPRTPQEDQLR